MAYLHRPAVLCNLYLTCGMSTPWTTATPTRDQSPAPAGNLFTSGIRMHPLDKGSCCRCRSTGCGPTKGCGLQTRGSAGVGSGGHSCLWLEESVASGKRQIGSWPSAHPTGPNGSKHAVSTSTPGKITWNLKLDLASSIHWLLKFNLPRRNSPLTIFQLRALHPKT